MIQSSDFSLKAVSPSSCWAALHLFWAGGPLLRGKWIQHERCSLQTPGAQPRWRRELGLGGWKKKELGVAWRNPPERAGWRGEFLRSLGSKSRSLNTAERHGAYQSPPCIRASVAGSPSSPVTVLVLASVGARICGRGSCKYVFGSPWVGASCRL